MPDLAQTPSAAEAAAQAFVPDTRPPAVLSRRLWDQITTRIVDLERIETLALAERAARRELDAAERALRRPGVTHADQERAWDAKRAHEAARTALDAALPETEGDGT
jgi:hypothetical protein